MPVNRMLPAPKVADVAAVRRQREQAEHFGAVALYAAAQGVPDHQAVAFFAEDMRAGRVLAYIRSHPGTSAEEADRLVADQDREAAATRPAPAPVHYAAGPTMLIEPMYHFADGTSVGG